MHRIYILCTLLLLALSLSAQTDTDTTEVSEDDEGSLIIPALNEKLKLGVKLGGGISVMLGNELSNPRPSYAMTGGAYLRYRFSKHWSLQPEANVSLRGSNFNNGADQYESIRMYYIDVPVLMLMGFDEKNKNNALAGVQYSRLLNSSLYIKDAPLPENTSPRLKKDDLMAVVGAQFHTPYVGFQILAKYGLIDINDGLLPNLNPPNRGKDIHNFVVEVNLLF